MEEIVPAVVMEKQRIKQALVELFALDQERVPEMVNSTEELIVPIGLVVLGMQTHKNDCWPIIKTAHSPDAASDTEGMNLPATRRFNEAVNLLEFQAMMGAES